MFDDDLKMVFHRFGQICGQQLLVLVWHSNQIRGVKKRSSFVHRQLGREDMEDAVVGRRGGNGRKGKQE